MALGTFSTGPYTAQYTPPSGAAGGGGGQVSLGLVEDVWRWQGRVELADMVAGITARSVIDSVYQGGNWFMIVTFKEWASAVKNTIWPWHSTFGQSGVTGRIATDLAGSLLLTAVAGTPAATAGPATITAAKALCIGDVLDAPLGAVERNIPVLFRIYPHTLSSGSVTWITET